MEEKLMDNSNDILELLDILYGMVNEAWGVPLGNDKCIIEREKAIDIINDIKAALPTSISESKRLVAARDEFIGNAKREAEALRKNAEEQANRLVEEQEIVRIASERSSRMLSDAEKKTSELKRVASQYVDQIMRQAEESLNSALSTVRQTQNAFKLNNLDAQEPSTEPEENDIPLAGNNLSVGFMKKQAGALFKCPCHFFSAIKLEVYRHRSIPVRWSSGKAHPV